MLSVKHRTTGKRMQGWRRILIDQMRWLLYFGKHILMLSNSLHIRGIHVEHNLLKQLHEHLTHYTHINPFLISHIQAQDLAQSLTMIIGSSVYQHVLAEFHTGGCSPAIVYLSVWMHGWEFMPCGVELDDLRDAFSDFKVFIEHLASSINNHRVPVLLLVESLRCHVEPAELILDCLLD